MSTSKSNALVVNPQGGQLVPVGSAGPSSREPQSAVRVLIVDNDAAHAEAIAECLPGPKYECTVAVTGKGGEQLIRQEVFDVVITDLVMHDVDGLEVLRTAHEEIPDAKVIVVTGHGSIASAVTAMHQGAFWFLQKPLDMATLRAIVDRAAQSQSLELQNRELQQRLDAKYGFERIIGSSPQTLQLIQRLQRIAPTDLTTLILGETGVGKDLIAQTIHQNSKRKEKRFVALNCSELSPQLLESELFGHVKGAYTDATSDREGRFEYAHGGTLFLDEVGDMPMTVQVKLLRVIENREIIRVGSNKPIKIDVRLIAATNRPLEKLVEEKTFRQDLYFRLKAAVVTVPPLRDRSGDVKLLLEHFFREAKQQHHRPDVKTISTAARRKLVAYPWPGNIRELIAAVSTMVALDQDGVIDLDDLPPEIAEHTGVLLTDQSDKHDLTTLVGRPLEDVERIFIEETLKSVDGNREEASRLLQIGQRTLYRKLKEWEKADEDRLGDGNG